MLGAQPLTKNTILNNLHKNYDLLYKISNYLFVFDFSIIVCLETTKGIIIKKSIYQNPGRGIQGYINKSYNNLASVVTRFLGEGGIDVLQFKTLILILNILIRSRCVCF